MSLYIDNDKFYFSAVEDSGRLYFEKALIWTLPYKEIKIYFGNQCCYSGHLFIFELSQRVQTEFGKLSIECRIKKSFPFYSYHFILTGSTTTRQNISQSLT